MHAKFPFWIALCLAACDGAESGSSAENPSPDTGPAGGHEADVGLTLDGGGGGGGALVSDALRPDLRVVDAEIDAGPDMARPDASPADAAPTLDAATPLPPGRLFVSPPSIDFGDVAAGATAAAQAVTVANQGEGPLFIERLRLIGAGFTMALGGLDLTPDRLGDPDADGAPGLSPGASFVLDLGHTSRDGARAIGELLIESSDPVERNAFVSLLANHGGPCLRLHPEAVEVGRVPLGGAVQAPVTLLSCGTAALRVDRITLTAPDDAVLSLSPDSVPRLPALLPAAVAGAALPARDVRVTCRPGEVRSYVATVEVETNDPVHPTQQVQVACEGIMDACPVPAVSRDVLETPLGETAVLDASPSTDPDGPAGLPVGYAWELVEAPQGSAAAVVESPGVPDDASTPTAELTPDVSGTYTVRLYVTDADGVRAPSELCPDFAPTVRIAAP